jgi:hypothetical protein
MASLCIRLDEDEDSGPDLAWAGRASPAKVQVSIASSNSTRPCWRTGLTLTAGRLAPIPTGSFEVPAQQRAHLGTSVTASWGDWGVCGWMVEGKGYMQVLFTLSNTRPALCCTSPPDRYLDSMLARADWPLVGAEQGPRYLATVVRCYLQACPSAASFSHCPVRVVPSGIQVYTPRATTTAN